MVNSIVFEPDKVENQIANFFSFKNNNTKTMNTGLVTSIELTICQTLIARSEKKSL